TADREAADLRRVREAAVHELGRVHHVTVVDVDAAPAESARNETAAGSQPGGHAEIDPLENPGGGGLLRRVWHQIVDTAECGWLDVVEPAQLIPAAAGQSRIARGRDAERVVIRRALEQVVGRLEIAVPGPVIPEQYPETGTQLVLHHG